MTELNHLKKSQESLEKREAKLDRCQTENEELIKKAVELEQSRKTTVENLLISEGKVEEMEKQIDKLKVKAVSQGAHSLNHYVPSVMRPPVGDISDIYFTPRFKGDVMAGESPDKGFSF